MNRFVQLSDGPDKRVETKEWHPAGGFGRSCFQATWQGGVVPDANGRTIISQGITVQLDGADHVARELVIHGNSVVPQGDANPDKTLTTPWVHVNSGGVFQVGSEADRVIRIEIIGNA